MDCVSFSGLVRYILTGQRSENGEENKMLEAVNMKVIYYMYLYLNSIINHCTMFVDDNARYMHKIKFMHKVSRFVGPFRSILISFAKKHPKFKHPSIKLRIKHPKFSLFELLFMFMFTFFFQSWRVMQHSNLSLVIKFVPPPSQFTFFYKQ